MLGTCKVIPGDGISNHSFCILKYSERWIRHKAIGCLHFSFDRYQDLLLLVCNDLPLPPLFFLVGGFPLLDFLAAVAVYLPPAVSLDGLVGDFFLNEVPPFCWDPHTFFEDVALGGCFCCFCFLVAVATSLEFFPTASLIKTFTILGFWTLSADTAPSILSACSVIFRLFAAFYTSCDFVLNHLVLVL